MSVEQRTGTIEDSKTQKPSNGEFVLASSTINFLQGFMKLCSGTEIPPMFAAWSALAGISCILGRRTWLEFGTSNIYPNMYICLVGGSGVVRKSTSINVVASMLRKVQPGPNIIAQKLTPEALIDSLKTVNLTDMTQFMKTTCTGFVIADELATFLNRQSYEAGIAPLLIQFFDCEASWEYRTKTGGSTTLTDTCLGMLCGTTIDWLANAIPVNAVGGGLTSRMIFVYVDQPAPPVPFPELTNEKRQLQLELIGHLERLSHLEGPYTLAPDARQWYADEYMRFYTSDDGHTLFNNPSLRGYASRRHMHQLKLSMLLAAAEGDKRLIELRHVVGATELLQTSEAHMPDVLNAVTSSELGLLQKQFADLVRRAPKKRVSKSMVLKAMGHRLTLRELEEIITTLKESRLLKVSVSATAEGSELWYEWVGVDPKQKRP